MDVATIIKERRIELGLTQKEVAVAVGVSEATVSRWEAGEIENMRRDRIFNLARVLAMSHWTGFSDHLSTRIHYWL